jgi:hypothetical protein
MNLTFVALEILREMMRKGAIRETEEPEKRAAMVEAAREMALGIWFEDSLMATSKQLYTEMDGTPEQICFADHAGDFSPTAANDLRFGTPTSGQFAIAGLASGSYWQSAKVDLGENRALSYKVKAALEFAATPTAGYTCDFWWVPSSSGTAGTANAAGASGSSASYTGYSSNAAASVKQPVYIGSFTCTAQVTATVQVAEIGILDPDDRYGSLIMLNGSGAAIHSDDVECHVVLSPKIPESQ